MDAPLPLRTSLPSTLVTFLMGTSSLLSLKALVASGDNSAVSSGWLAPVGCWGLSPLYCLSPLPCAPQIDGICVCTWAVFVSWPLLLLRSLPEKPRPLLPSRMTHFLSVLWLCLEQTSILAPTALYCAYFLASFSATHFGLFSDGTGSSPLSSSFGGI